MNKTIATIASAAGAVLPILLAASPAGASTAAIPSAMRHHLQPCPVSQMHGSLSGEGAAGGAQEYALTVTNEGPACTVTGYPRLRERTTAGKLAYPYTIRGPVLGVPDEGPHTVTLAQGQKVTAEVAWGFDGPTGATAVAKLYAGFRGEPGWVPVVVPNGPAYVYGNAISETAWAKTGR